MPKLWGGRFSQAIDPLAARLNDLIDIDFRMASQDIQGSIAWAKAIHKAGLLETGELQAIVSGLEAILIEVGQEAFQIQPDDEDVHTAVERRLGELIGPVAGKLHTGRSRNDQVMTDFNLWAKEAITGIDQAVMKTQKSLLARAIQDTGIALPGYTHFQRAQPILLSHWWLSHFWPLQRDRQKLSLLASQADVLPLGSGAIAGTSFPVDRIGLAADLGFTRVSPNSIDAVSSRDLAATLLFDLAMIGMHLSRLAEALILYATSEFGFIELADAYSTGSSLMPQKKNPDMLELIRGKSGVLTGKLTGLLATLKGLPSAYDKDLQEDKEPVFSAVDTVLILLPVMTGILDSLNIHPDKMAAAIDASMLATELADYLVEKGVPFRQAHGITGKIIAYAHENNVDLVQAPLAEFHPAFAGKSFQQIVSLSAAIDRRNVIGGTGSQAVADQIAFAQKLLEDNSLQAGLSIA